MESKWGLIQVLLPIALTSLVIPLLVTTIYLLVLLTNGQGTYCNPKLGGYYYDAYGNYLYTPSYDSSTSTSSYSTGQIAGGAGGGVAGILCLSIFFYCYCCRRSNTVVLL